MIEIHDQIMVYKINNEAQNDEFKKEVGNKLEANQPPVINIFGGIKKKLAETKVKQDLSEVSQFQNFMKDEDIDARTDFLNALKLIIQLRMLDRKAIRNVFDLSISKSILEASKNKQKTLGVELIIKTLKHVGGPAPISLLKLVLQLAKSVPVFVSKKGFGFTTASNSIQQQYMFLQMTLATQANKFNIFCQLVPKVNIEKMNILIQKLIDTVVNPAIANDEAYKVGAIQKVMYQPFESLQGIIFFLLENGFFKQFALKMLKIPECTADPMVWDSVFGVLLGLQINNKTITRNSLVACMKGIKASTLNGLIGVILKDASVEKDILNLATDLNLNGKLVLQLLTLIQGEPEAVAPSVNELVKEHTKSPELIASVVALFRQDILATKFIAERMGVNEKDLMNIVGAATGKVSLLEDFFASLAGHFKFSKVDSVETIIRLLHGDTKKIFQMSGKSNLIFQLNQPAVLESLVYITQTGLKIEQLYGDFLNNTDLTYLLEQHLSTLWRQLKTSFKIIPFGEQNKEMVQKRAYYRKKLLDKQKKIEKDPEILKKVEEQLNIPEAKPIDMLEAKHSLYLITSAIWKDKRSLKELSNRLTKHPETNKLWKDPLKPLDMKLAFIQKMFRQIVNLRDRIKQHRQKSRTQHQTILLEDVLPTLNKWDDLDQKQRKDKADQVDYKLKESDFMTCQKLFDKAKTPVFQDKDLSEQDQFILKMGCTFNSTFYMDMPQKFFVCDTCQDTAAGDQKEIGICVPCAMICHKGHELRSGNYGLKTKISCDCGSGAFMQRKEIDLTASQDEINKLMTSTDDLVIYDGKCRIQYEFEPFEEAFKNKLLIDDRLNMHNYFERNENKKHKNAILGMIGKVIEQQVGVAEDNDESVEMLGEENEVELREEDLYTTMDFIKDLECSLNLDDEFRQIVTCEQLLRRGYEFYDFYLDSKVDFVTNWILLSAGKATHSFLTAFCQNQEMTKATVDLSEITNNETQKPDHKSDYAAICTIMSLIQQDIEQLDRLGESFTKLLQIHSVKEFTAIDKLNALISLNKGRPLRSYQKAMRDAKIGKYSDYEKLFVRIFGNHGLKVMVLHQMLVMKHSTLIKVLSLNKKTMREESKEIQDLWNWIDQFFFTQILNLDEEQKSWCKSLITYTLGDASGLDFLIKEKEVPPAQAQFYKFMTSNEQEDFKKILLKLDSSIPFAVSSLVYQVLNQNQQAFVKFYEMVYLIFNNPKKIFWADYLKDNQKARVENALRPVEETLQRNARVAFLSMLGSDKIQLQGLKTFLQIHNYTYAVPQGMDEAFQQQLLLNEDCYLLINAVQDIFSGNIIDFGNVFNCNSLHTKSKIDAIKTVMAIESKKNSQEMIMTLASNCLLSVFEDSTSPKPYYKERAEKVHAIIDAQRNPFTLAQRRAICNLIYATQGNMDSMAVFCSDISSEGDSMIFELITSLSTKETNARQIEMDPVSERIIQTKWKLEIKRLFGKIIKIAVGDHNKKLKSMGEVEKLSQNEEGLKNLLQFVEEKRMTEQLFMMMSKDKIFISRILDPAAAFCVSIPLAEQEARKLVSAMICLCDTKTMIPSMQPIFARLAKSLGVPTESKGSKEVILVKIPIEERNEFLAQFTSFEEETFDAQVGRPIEVIESEYEDLLEELCMKVEMDGERGKNLQMDLIGLSTLLFNCADGNANSIKALFSVFNRLYINTKLMRRLFYLFFSLFSDAKESKFVHLPSIVLLLIASEREREGKTISKMDEFICKSIVSWMQSCLVLLDKEKATDMTGIEDQFLKASKTTEDVMEFAQKSGVGNIKSEFGPNSIKSVTDILVGLMNLTKGNLEHIKPLFLKLGAFPEPELFDKLLKVLTKFKSLLQGKADLKKQMVEAAKAQLEEKMNKGMEAASGALGKLGIPTPNDLFIKMDKDNSGFVELNEFKDICKYMGLEVSEENLIKVFALSDRKKRRKLDLADFAVAQIRLRMLVAEEALAKTGLSKKELILAVIYSVVFLLMLFAFIFIGISAFSKASSFGSMVNSTLPMSAGGATSGDVEADGKDDESLMKRLEEGIEKALDDLRL